jgi:pimeloyl-ACP methyl ester carboxylesterase
MLQPRQHFVRSLSPHGFHRVAYREWGHPASSRTLVCVHGLTRNGRDFDVLAATLADRFRVLCPDMPGRGDSEWLKDPNDYVFPTYLTALTAVLAHADVDDEISWLGTSMGGLLGMILAAQPATPIKRLVVNDIGPAIELTALQRIAGYVGLDPVFESFKALEAHVREVSAPFGELSDAQWSALAESTARQTPDGRWKLKYDPGIAVPFRSSAGSGSDLWAIWDSICCPTLLLRGAESDLLSAQTAAAMRTRGPKPRLIEFAGVGHAPMLLVPEQIAAVAAFLDAV